MLLTTRGIVIRNVKYGETSYVSNIYTQALGMQTYMIQGVRGGSKKSTTKANSFQVGAVLEMIVYHTPHKNMQRIKEIKTDFVFATLQTNVIKNTIVQYIAELLYHTIDNQEQNEVLFNFLEKMLHTILTKDTHALATFPIVFTWQYAALSGFALQNNFTQDTPYLNLAQGAFISHAQELHTLDKNTSMHIYQLLVQNDYKIEEGKIRYEILLSSLLYIQLHMKPTLRLKSIEVIHAILHT